MKLKSIARYLFSKHKKHLFINILVFIIGWFFIYVGLNSTPTLASILISIGASLFATGIVLLLDIWKRYATDKIAEKIDNIITESGVEWISKKRDLDKYDDLIANMQNSLDICGYSLGGFFESYGASIKKKQNTTIRVLFVNPDSTVSAQRVKIEGKHEDQFKALFSTFTNFFKDTNFVENRTIDFPLSTMIYRIDDTMFVGPHFYKKQSKATLTMELSKDKWLFDEYQKEFDRMWESAEPLNKRT